MVHDFFLKSPTGQNSSEFYGSFTIAPKLAGADAYHDDPRICGLAMQPWAKI